MPLNAMREQLEYWQAECERARQAGDVERIGRCERFIQQCEKVIDALKQAGSPPTAAADSNPQFFFERHEGQDGDG